MPTVVVIAAFALALRAVGAVVMWFADVQPAPGVEVPELVEWLAFDQTNLPATIFDNAPGEVRFLGVWTVFVVAAYTGLIVLLVRGARGLRTVVSLLCAAAVLFDLAHVPGIVSDWVGGHHVYDYGRYLVMSVPVLSVVILLLINSRPARRFFAGVPAALSTAPAAEDE